MVREGVGMSALSVEFLLWQLGAATIFSVKSAVLFTLLALIWDRHARPAISVIAWLEQQTMLIEK